MPFTDLLQFDLIKFNHISSPQFRLNNLPITIENPENGTTLQGRAHLTQILTLNETPRVTKGNLLRIVSGKGDLDMLLWVHSARPT